MNIEECMKIAVKEAKISLCEGNHGFGAAIMKNGQIIASAHDKEDTENDPTSHAEMNVIREASRKLGKKLSGCILVSTHEPCPMCASAIVWSSITEIAYGYSIHEALSQGRERIVLPCTEVFNQSNVNIKISAGILNTECSVLYREDVRKEIENLRGVDDRGLDALNEDSICRRTKWFQANRHRFHFITDDLLGSGYQLLLERFHITAAEAPVIKKTDQEIVFHSMNFCPTLEACRILALDTRYICKRLNETSTDCLLKQIDPRLNFSRNYDKLRPYSEYCEEMVSIQA
ncbi:MAG TPA: nucleoside deaminase [Firmicutes bacterium]|jgi:tRNA(adenine34) deaminase|nr:nucleoside deaminase [Bacillota bacterium]